MKQTTVNSYCKGDEDKKGQVLFIAETKKQAKQYLADYIHCHSTKTYPFVKDGKDSYASKFQRVWLS